MCDAGFLTERTRPVEQRERNIRAAIAWRLFDVGDAVTRAAHKICDDIPTVSTASSGWFAAGQSVGHRAGVRDAAAIIAGGAR